MRARCAALSSRIARPVSRSSSRCRPWPEESDSSLFYELYNKKEEFVWNPTREKYLRKIIALCKEHHVQLFLYESTPYFGSVYDQVNRKNFINRTHEIAFENGIQYFTFDTLPLTYEKKHFVCPLIFTVQGSQVFMKEFAKTVNKNYEGFRVRTY